MKKLILFMIFALFLAGGEIKLEKVYDVSPGVKLKVELISSDLKINSWEKNQVRIRIHLRYSGSKPEVITEGSEDEVFLKIRPARKFCFFCRRDNYKGKVEITVPRKISADLHTVSGNISGEMGEIKDGDIHSVSGDIILKINRVEALRLETISGDIRTSLDEGESVNSSSISGDVRIQGDALTRVKINTISGDVYLQGKSGDRWCLHSISGDIHIRAPERVCLFNLKSTGGEIQSPFLKVERKLNWRKCEEGLSIRAKTISGDIFIGGIKDQEPRKPSSGC